MDNSIELEDRKKSFVAVKKRLSNDENVEDRKEHLIELFKKTERVREGSSNFFKNNE